MLRAESTNKDKFYEQQGEILAVLASLPKSGIKIIIGAFNAEVENDNSYLRSVIGRHCLHKDCNKQKEVDYLLELTCRGQDA